MKRRILDLGLWDVSVENIIARVPLPEPTHE